MRAAIAIAVAMTASLCAASSRAQSVQDFINDHQALEAAAQQCNAEVNQHFQQMRWAISRGMQPSPMPMCQLGGCEFQRFLN